MNIKINKAVTGLYEEFRAYPLKSVIDTCPHCGIEAEERKLHQKLLNELTWADLEVYCFKAVTTFGDVDDFKHFLPRLCELLVIDYDNLPCGIDILLSKIEYCEFDKWPEEQQRIVRQFMKVWSKSMGGWKREEINKAMEECGFVGELTPY